MTGFNTFAFASEELRATIRMLRSICDEMYLIREQITSITGYESNMMTKIKTKHKLQTKYSTFSMKARDKENI